MASVQRGRVDDLRGGQLAFDLEDAALDEALLVLGGFVLGVLRQVALGTRLGNRLDHRVALLRLQLMQLFLEFFGTALGEGDGGHWGLLQMKGDTRRRWVPQKQIRRAGHLQTQAQTRRNGKTQV